MKKLNSDESAISYGIFLFYLLIVFVGIIFILITPAVNEIIGTHNDFVDSNDISQQNQDTFNFNVNVYKSVPLFALFGLVFWGVVRSISKQGDEGV